MRWMIASDIHGSAYYCKELLKAFESEKADRLLLLGDILYHGPRNDLPKGYAPKEVIMKETFWKKRQKSLENITRERGIQLRMNRSIQVEGAFGLIKNDFGFRRFLTTGKKNVKIELLFLALGFNLKKRWMKQQKRRLETHYSEKKVA
mgnify:CR=1 FL=1